MVELGLGLIGIGKPWGLVNPVVPGESEALRLLERAFALGVRYFDTAPSYGVSEARLGKFLRSLRPAERAQVRIATKFGEHWDCARGEPFVDHSFEALQRSLMESVARLEKIDVLQLHKTTPAVLRSEALARVQEGARQLGIATLGASVSDEESARLTVANPEYGTIQLPYNVENTRFGDAIDAAAAAGMRVAVNRPFGMGKLAYGERAFRFVLQKRFEGVVLSGTKSIEHLQENWEAFHRIQRAGQEAYPTDLRV